MPAAEPPLLDTTDRLVRLLVDAEGEDLMQSLFRVLQDLREVNPRGDHDAELLGGAEDLLRRNLLTVQLLLHLFRDGRLRLHHPDEVADRLRRPCCVRRASGEILYANDAYAELVGCDRRALVSSTGIEQRVLDGTLLARHLQAALSDGRDDVVLPLLGRAGRPSVRLRTERTTDEHPSLVTTAALADLDA